MAMHRLGHSARANETHRYFRNLGYAANSGNYTLGAGVNDKPPHLYEGVVTPSCN
jgi:hypothetical protein